MKIKQSLFLAILLSMGIAMLANTNIASAQGISIKFSPTRIEEIVDPGEVLYKNIEVTNQSDIAKTFFVYIKDFVAEGEGGVAKLLPPGSQDYTTIASWIKADTEGMEFGSYQTKTINFSIEVPENAGPGGHYGALVVGTEPPNIRAEGEDKGAAISIAQQTGPLILLQVRGDVIEEASIREFSTDKEVYGTPFDIKFISRVENHGNVHIKPMGSIGIINMFGKEVEKISFNDVGSNVLPNTIRRFEDNWNGDFAFGRYKAIIGLSYGTSAKFGGQGKKSIDMEKTFWIIPWKIVLPIFLAIVFVGALIVLIFKFYKSKAVKKAMQQMGMSQGANSKKAYGASPVMHFGLILMVFLVLVFILSIMLYFLFFA